MLETMQERILFDRLVRPNALRRSNPGTVEALCALIYERIRETQYVFIEQVIEYKRVVDSSGYYGGVYSELQEGYPSIKGEEALHALLDLPEYVTEQTLERVENEVANNLPAGVGRIRLIRGDYRFMARANDPGLPTLLAKLRSEQAIAVRLAMHDGGFIRYLMHHNRCLMVSLITSNNHDSMLHTGYRRVLHVPGSSDGMYEFEPPC